MDTISTTLGSLVVAEPALQLLAKLELPERTAYHVAKLLRLVSPELKHFHEKREAYIKEYGEERETTAEEKAAGMGERVTSVTDEKREAFIAKVEELALVPVELAWRPIKISALTGSKLKAEDILPLLDTFLIDDTE